AMQAFGLVALLSLALGAVLTATGVFARGLAANSASSVKPAYAAMDTDTPTPTSTPNPCGPVWSVVSSPNVDTSSNVLKDVEVVTANDVWAVGYYYAGPYQTLIEHWDGASWSVVPSPNIGTYENYLSGVAVVSANDVWAVGDY